MWRPAVLLVAGVTLLSASLIPAEPVGALSRSESAKKLREFLAPHGSYSAGEQKKAVAAINQEVDAALGALRNRVAQQACESPIYFQWGSSKPSIISASYRCSETGSDYDFFIERKTGSKVSGKARSDPYYPGNVPILFEIVAKRLNALDWKVFRNYRVGSHGNITGTVRENSTEFYHYVVGAEFLLADGRTLLRVSYDGHYTGPTCMRGEGCRDGGTYGTRTSWSVADVRRIPTRLAYHRTVDDWSGYTDGGYPKSKDFGAQTSSPRELVELSKLHRAAPQPTEPISFGLPTFYRPIDPAVLDPAEAASMAIEPELIGLGQQIAQRRWGTLDVMYANFNANVGSVNTNANALEARLDRQEAMRMARLTGSSSNSGGSSIIAGIAEGLSNFARDQAFWQARSQENMRRLYRAQRGCDPLDCGPRSASTSSSASTQGARSSGQQSTANTATQAVAAASGTTRAPAATSTPAQQPARSAASSGSGSSVPSLVLSSKPKQSPAPAAPEPPKINWQRHSMKFWSSFTDSKNAKDHLCQSATSAAKSRWSSSDPAVKDLSIGGCSCRTVQGEGAWSDVTYNQCSVTASFSYDPDRVRQSRLIEDDPDKKYKQTGVVR